MAKRNNFIYVDLTDFSNFIDLLDENTKDENIEDAVNKALSAGFELQQKEIDNNWTHTTNNENRKSSKKHTIEYLLHDDTPIWKDNEKASLGTGFLFNNEIPPLSPLAEGGIIAQYLAYGTKEVNKATGAKYRRIKPDDRLKRAIAGKAIKDKVNKLVEDICVEEIEKLIKIE
jgi:hypothetical protein